MSERPTDRWEQQVHELAASFRYPATPPLSQKIRWQAEPKTPRHFRLALVGAVLLVLLSLAVSMPPVRAALVEFFQIGAIRLQLIDPTPTATVTSIPAPTNPAAGPELSPTFTPVPTLISSLFELSGPTTLEEAQQLVDFQIPLPGYPDGIGGPDHVFVQDFQEPLIIMVWMDPDNPSQVLLSLHVISPGSWAGEKWAFERILETDVNGENAVWVQGPYIVKLLNQNHDLRRLVEGNVLIWKWHDLTLRLESGLSLAEAVRVAESVK